MRKLIGTAATALLVLAFVAAPAFAGAGSKPGPSTIVEIVLAEDGEFDVLQAAVIEAGLVDALNSSADQYTVFAPTDAAFVSTFRVVLGDTSLTEANVIAFIDGGGVDAAMGSGALADVLLYHVTSGRRTSTSVLAAPRYHMLNGMSLRRDDLLAAGIAAVNVPASNGVIHVISSVLLP